MENYQISQFPQLDNTFLGNTVKPGSSINYKLSKMCVRVCICVFRLRACDFQQLLTGIRALNVSILTCFLCLRPWACFPAQQNEGGKKKNPVAKSEKHSLSSISNTEPSEQVLAHIRHDFYTAQQPWSFPR